MLCLLYILAIVSIYLQFKIPIVFVAFLLVFNLLILVCFGNYMLRAILFPYANYFIKKEFDSNINKRFSREFARLLR